MYHDPARLFRLEPKNRATPVDRAFLSLPEGFHDSHSHDEHTHDPAPASGGTGLLWLWAVGIAVLAFVVWYFFGQEASALSAVVLTHPGCKQSLREDMRAGLIYGPYARERNDRPRVICSVCKGSGSYANYSQDTINKDLAGKPAPCEFCKGSGTRAQLEYLTMAQWADLTGLCVYCGTPRRKARTKKETTTEVHANG